MFRNLHKLQTKVKKIHRKRNTFEKLTQQGKIKKPRVVYCPSLYGQYKKSPYVGNIKF